MVQTTMTTIPQDTATPPARRRRGCGCLPLALGALIILLLLASYGYYVYQAAWPRLTSGRAHLEHALAILRTDPPTALTPDLLAAARADFVGAASDFRAVRDSTGPLLALAPSLGWVPQVGGDLTQAPALLTLAVDGSDLGTALIDGVAPAVAQMHTTGTPPPAADGDSGLAGALSPVIDALGANPDALARAQQSLTAVQADRAAVDGSRVSDPRLRKALDEIDAGLPQLERALNSLGGLPHAVDTLLGRTQPTTFLVLVQNQDELRATGGFLSAVGLLTIDRGKFTQVQFADSYAVDNPQRPPLQPPADLARYMQAGGWYIRDANWAPDFPRTAQTAENFYQLDQGVTVDGTLAVDQQMLQKLLAAVGPVTLPGYPDQITAANVVGLMRHYFLPDPGDLPPDWWQHRKDFMRDLFHALTTTLPTLPREKLLALAVAFAQGLDQKHLQVYTHDPDTERWLRGAGWDGALAPAPGDTLAVVDSNMGFNKVNAVVVESMTYTVTLGTAPSAPAQATLALTYRNSSTPDGRPCVQDPRYKDSYEALTQGCYWDYVRIYVPPGSTLGQARWADADPHMQHSAEYGMSAFSAFLIVPPGEEKTLTVDYTLPLTATTAGERNTYDLLVRKQPGTDAVPLTVAVRLPSGALLRTSRPEAPAPAAGWVRYAATPLDTDRTIHLGW